MNEYSFEEITHSTLTVSRARSGQATVLVVVVVVESFVVAIIDSRSCRVVNRRRQYVTRGSLVVRCSPVLYSSPNFDPGGHRRPGLHALICSADLASATVVVVSYEQPAIIPTDFHCFAQVRLSSAVVVTGLSGSCHRRRRCCCCCSVFF